jgi:WD40 repeat protein
MIINSLLLSPEFVISAGWDCRIILWDICQNSKLSEFKCDDSYLNIVCWFDSTKKMVLAGGKNGYLALIQL